MLKVKTLVHKKALPIAKVAISSFHLCCKDPFQMEIHHDGSLSEQDIHLLLTHTSHPTFVISPEERAKEIDGLLINYPNVQKILKLKGFYTKIEMAIISKEPFFYFDSDIVWLQAFKGLVPNIKTSVFSQESLTWYYGIKNYDTWIAHKVPRRICAGLFYLYEPFPINELECFIKNNMYDIHAQPGDQPIFAYLYRNMMTYSTSSILRVYSGVRYNLNTNPTIALHFTGSRWKKHITSIENFKPRHAQIPKEIMFNKPHSLTKTELILMDLKPKIQRLKFMHSFIKAYRFIRAKLVN